MKMENEATAKVIPVTRQIDSVGRVVIPKEIREDFNMEIGDKITFYKTKDGLLLVKSN